MRNSCCAKLHTFSFGLALGIVWGISMLIAGLIALTTGYAVAFVETMRTMYIGYQATVPGSLIGGLWGFVDMFVAGIILAGLYNLFLGITCKNRCACLTPMQAPKKSNAKNKHNKNHPSA